MSSSSRSGSALAITKFLLILLLPPEIFTICSLPYALPMGIVTSALILWVSNLIPPAATAILVPCLAILYGVLTPTAAFHSFGNGVLGLFVGVFLIVRAFQKTGLDRRAAVAILRSRFSGGSPTRLIFLAALSAWILGMWMSNTAACAVLLPIFLGIADRSKDHLPQSLHQAFTTRLLLTCAYTPSIGGMTTPVGSVPNVLAIHHLSRHDIEPGFLEWLLLALPVSATLLFASMGILHLLFPVTGYRFSGSWTAEEHGHKVLTGHSRLLGAISMAVLLLWLAPEAARAIRPEWSIVDDRLPLAVPPLLGAISLFLLRVGGVPLLEAKDITRIDWGTVLLFGGGLCLGEVLNSSGAASAMAQRFIAGAGENTGLLLALTASTCTLLSEVSSNTTTAAIVIPVLSNLPLPSGNSLTLILSSVFAAGLGFMLPISTPPNALVYGTGRVQLLHMIAAGALLDVIGIGVITAFGVLR